jgi:nitrate/nitrite-specific signal transduction histidine kinase
MSVPRAEFPYWRATIVYVLALALIAAAVIAGYFIVAGLNERTAEDAALVNAAGRQRVRAQRIARLALAIRATHDPNQRAARLRELQATFERWRQGHDDVVRGRAARRVAPLRFQSSAERYASLDAEFLAVDTATKRMLAYADVEGKGRSEPPRLGALGTSCDAYATEMDGLVLALEQESEAQVQEAGVTLKAIVVGSVLLLAAEGLLVFRPLIRGLRGSYRDLHDAHRDLERELELRLEAERERDALKGLLPICAGCKKIRDDAGDWRPLEQFIEARSEARFSHGLCQDCLRRLYPEQADAVLAKMSEPERNGA